MVNILLCTLGLNSAMPKSQTPAKHNLLSGILAQIGFASVNAAIQYPSLESNALHLQAWTCVGAVHCCLSGGSIQISEHLRSDIWYILVQC